MDPGPTGYVAFPPGPGSLGFDDYDSIQDGQIELTEIRFVGGVTTDGGTLVFEFYDITHTTLQGSFSTTLASAGNFIYTINLATHLFIPDTGILEISADVASATEGQWFLGDAGPNPGTENPLIGSIDTFAHNFELTNTDIPVELMVLSIE